ncbi:MAG: outer membrane lipoprotein-sorting protein [Chlorobiales bacterium]|nr:outer membrane lipoprotein-sorting protein [Chlorobiales bacterium]
MYKVSRSIIIPVMIVLLLGSQFQESYSMPSGSKESETLAVNVAPNAGDVLKKADAVRAPWGDFTMIAEIAFEKHGQLKKEKFRVFIKDYLKTLVSYLEPAKQRGNMLLMVGENLWYYVSNTKRPMRITPIQKLSGGTSYGDITRLSWSDDYIPEMVGEQNVEVGEQSFDTWFLKLKAKTKSATYHTIDLYVERESFFPRKAVVYLQSGKKMKTMYFTKYRIMAGKMMNTRIDFIDHLSSDSETSLVFSAVDVRKFPDRFFLKSSLSSLYGEVVY